MKLLSLIIYKYQEDNSVEVQACEELTSFGFFHRGPLREHIKFHSRLIVNRTESGKRSAVEMENNVGKCYSFVHPSGLGAAVLIDAEYPMRVAYTLLNEALRIFLERTNGKWEGATSDTNMGVAEVDELFVKFQNPAEADKLTKIEKDLEEVKGTVMQSMDDLLKRGENLDQLMQKSKDLSNTSVQFYRTAKKNNQCCKMY